MNATTQADDLSNPNHPLHRPAKPAAAAPAATPAPAAKPAKEAKVKTAKPAKAKKATAVTGKKSTIKATPDNPAKSIVPVRFKQAYAAHNDTNGSKLSLALKEATTKTNDDGREALDVDALFAIAKANGIETKPYASLNNGQKRMNVRNKLAGLIKNGTTVVIGKQRFASEQAVKPAQAA